jgi:hypothetical protein
MTETDKAKTLLNFFKKFIIYRKNKVYYNFSRIVAFFVKTSKKLKLLELKFDESIFFKDINLKNNFFLYTFPTQERC